MSNSLLVVILGCFYFFYVCKDSGYLGQTYIFNVGMTCDGCANQIKKVVSKLGDKVTNIETDVPNNTVKITTSLKAEEILETLKKTGKQCSLVA